MWLRMFTGRVDPHATVQTFTVEPGLCVEASAVPALPLLLLLCPSASQHPEVPSRATTTAQTPRPPMSVALRDRTQITKVSIAWFYSTGSRHANS